MEEKCCSEELIPILPLLSRKQNCWRESGSLSSRIPMPALSGTIVGSSCVVWKEKIKFGELFPLPCFPLQDASLVLGGFKDI